VAVITALLLTTLAITIVASLFWQQQVQVRSIENQRLQLQKQWILRGALDWTRLILREDARYSQVDHLGEPWAVSLAETRLDQYVENARANNNDVPDAAISGSIVDAQSRLNLTNLSTNGTVNREEVAAFARLLSSVQLNPALAQATADTMAAAQNKPAAPSGPRSSATGGTTSATSATSATSTTSTTSTTAPGSKQALDIAYVDDLLAVPGFTPEMLAKVKDFLVVLPIATAVNVNTAPAEVLAARIDTLSLSEAAVLVATREKAWFRDVSDMTQRLGRSIPQTQIAFKTNYFLVNGNVRLNRAALEMQALIKRSDPGGNPTTEVVWIREH
jgi:general secretion pathway protein K